MKRLGLIVGLVACLGFCGAASATLINLSSRDYLAAGDGLITFDSSTNLEWLDLTYTSGGPSGTGTGTSIRQGEALAFFDGVGTNGKFRWATEAEIRHLLANVPFASGLPEFGLRVVSDADAIADALSFVDLLGNTYGFLTTDQFTAAQGVSRGYPASGDRLGNPAYGGGTLGVSAQTATTVAVAGTISEFFNNRFVSEDVSAATRGLWFVRSANPVPEPTTLALMTLGLAGLGYSTRHRNTLSKH